MLIALKPNQKTIDIVAALKGRWHGSYAVYCCVHGKKCRQISSRDVEFARQRACR